MNEIKELFYKSNKFSTKLEKYFDVYELLLRNLKKKILHLLKLEF